ncbi:predicted protein [Postia placenta Mad-698-R]|uniref:Uncharacterized protein n=1 Tax=Postia placenta MAD-698-R-SB12 TaxID=670580 RepID=A0A1X6MRD4_9APHY|nr:hypothetical protein POSPLADRAFT_1151426 [Postia placenta MAD-698-R-SB12]EED84278.1 predicted protein [Postia placenta Mad-698-R]OSX58732.1 hypothetical protein POSPLADRAFT_1151426 [Postia placenta MAD-698-R-SB12]
MMKFSGALPWKYHIDLEYFEQRAVEFYFNKGGKIEYALDLITSLDQLIAELESGEETIEQAHGYLPACVNDREKRNRRMFFGEMYDGSDEEDVVEETIKWVQEWMKATSKRILRTVNDRERKWW